ncbi:hypothetical protein AAA799O18_00189 [Marine Group I thaumarchaeote SCGC AAA799-O18]|jgi:hypothetical protein|nr:hypothetical protein AAA799O18_00189 [Marine Group I thaumarchaeote SCGC AAA799-O18]
MQDPNPLPWGAQDRFQAHFIVKRDSGEKLLRFTARTNLKTTGYFGSKKITGVSWEGGELAEQLNADSSLNKKLIKQSVDDATIFVDPTNNGIRIYGKWKNSHDFRITKELFEIYDKIAGYIKKLN